MVDRISNESNTHALETIKEQLKANSADKVQGLAPSQVKGTGFSGEDAAATKTTISSEAAEKARADQQVLRFSRTAGRIQDAGQQPDKVSSLKALYDSGDISSYLNQIDSNSLADSLLKSPVGNYLKQAAA